MLFRSSLWRKANQLWSTQAGDLRESLGPWIVGIHRQRQKHGAYLQHDQLSEADSILWVRCDEMYLKCTKEFGNKWQYRESNTSCAWIELPRDATPADAQLIAPSTWTMEYASGAGMKFCPIRLESASTFADYIACTPDWEQELLHHTDMLEDPFSVSLALGHGVRAVSDGSVREGNHGAFGWIVSTDQGDRVSKGMGPARGVQVDSYRAEAYGMLTVLVFLRRLAEFTDHRQPWSGILATDSQSLLDAISEKTLPDSDSPPIYGKVKDLRALDVRCAEWDLLSSILLELREYPNLKLEYVAAHQDRKTSYERLSLMAQLNVDADDMATKFQEEFGDSRPSVLLTSTAGVHLCTPAGTHTSNYNAVIRHQTTREPLWKTIQKRYRWTSRTMNSVN